MSPSTKATASAPANIAFVKYWGAVDLDAALPLAPSLSMTLERCRARTTVELVRGESGPTEIRLLAPDGRALPVPPAFAAGIERHLVRLAAELGITGRFRVATVNGFPADAGLASSAAGFAALAIAVARAAGADLGPAALSQLARSSGSGSAARSVLGGYVEWPAGGDPSAPAEQVAAAAHWPLADVIAIVETGAKPVSSREGHRRAPSSPHFARRLELLPERLEAVRRAVAARDLAALGAVLEEEAVELHLVAMSSRPPIFYWRPGTLAVIEEVHRLRDGGLPAYLTMDAGANVHVICEPEAAPRVAAALAALPEVREIIRDEVGEGPRLHEEHLW